MIHVKKKKHDNSTLPKILDEFIVKIKLKLNSFLDSEESLMFTGPTQRKSINNITISYNIYSEDTVYFGELETILTSYFKDFSSNGELILYQGSVGEIIDQGKQAFNILKANHYEFYIYEPETVIYCRLLKEYDPLKDKTWISIDFDIIIKSSWFSDDSF